MFDTFPAGKTLEAYLDVASHVLSDRGLRAPTTYAETFEVLVQAGLMSADLGRVMIEMTGFRNVVVHEYTRIDPEVAIRILRERLEDFRRFETEALGWL